MSSTIGRPTCLRINAWNAVTAVESELSPKTPFAQIVQGRAIATWLAPLAEADLRDWRHPDVGWGLVLLDNDDLSHDELARGIDAPAPIRKLLLDRPGAPVLRWRPELQQSYLRRYYSNGKPPQDLSISAPKPGVKEGHIPRYLLIYATPKQIPWAVQYALNMSTFVGRIDLSGVALDNYVNALISDWPENGCDPKAPLVWRVDHGSDDITWLMARAVAAQIWKKFESDVDLSRRILLRDESATQQALCAALKEHNPGLIITTSHGMTGPLNDSTALKLNLGIPVDVNHQTISMMELADWQPNGAIWYAHACCSAGSDSESRYEKLFSPNSAIGLTLNGIASGAGAVVAPMPSTLLGKSAPLRAFVGHVEPTFDWTLRDPNSGEVLAQVLCSALYNSLYLQDRRTPIGFALRSIFTEAGAFYGAWQDAVTGIDNNVPGMRDWALYRQLVAMDRQTLVILGDPTVALPQLSGI